jgi:hypothetical protein
MKLNKLVLFVVAVVGMGAVGCGSVEGTYKLDKDAMKKSAEAEIAKKPAADQAAAKAMLGMFDAMDMTLELKSGGAASMKTSLGAGHDKEETGTWKKDGDAIVVSSGKGKDIKCQKDGSKLKCNEAGGKDDTQLVFVKS